MRGRCGRLVVFVMGAEPACDGMRAGRLRFEFSTTPYSESLRVNLLNAFNPRP